jgi:cation diffusion facilitator CzcD-associated flavoprotein CzcO
MAIGSEVEHWDIVIVGAGIAGLATVCDEALQRTQIIN